MNIKEFGNNPQEETENRRKIREYAAALNINITGSNNRSRLLRDLKRMQNGEGDIDVRNGQFGRFTDDELGNLYTELLITHK